MRIAFAIFLVLPFIPIAATAGSQAAKVGTAASTTLTNQDVLSMLKAGLSADIVVAAVKASPCCFDTSPAGLEKLKAAAVPDSVILAMVEASAHSDKAASALAPVETPAAPAATIAPGAARVVSISTMQTYSQSSGVYTDSSGNIHGGGSGDTMMRQVYRLETADAVFEVTGWESTGLFGKARKRPALQVGDVVSYRVDPKHGQFIDILLTDTDKKQKVEWHRFLRVGSEKKGAQ